MFFKSGFYRMIQLAPTVMNSDSEDVKNFACHPCSTFDGNLQKHSTPPSGVPFRTNLLPAGAGSYEAN